MSAGVILYGAPATGKDTVSRELAKLDSRFVLFERLKAGPGRTAGYRMTSEAELGRLESAGELIWANERYNARYAIDRPTLSRMIAAGLRPVVHAGQPEVIDAIRDAFPAQTWTVVELRCSRDTATDRIIARSTGDIEDRLTAWDATPSLPAPDATIDTEAITAEDAARIVLDLAQ